MPHLTMLGLPSVLRSAYNEEYKKNYGESYMLARDNFYLNNQAVAGNERLYKDSQYGVLPVRFDGSKESVQIWQGYKPKDNPNHEDSSQVWDRVDDLLNGKPFGVHDDFHYTAVNGLEFDRQNGISFMVNDPYIRFDHIDMGFGSENFGKFYRLNNDGGKEYRVLSGYNAESGSELTRDIKRYLKRR